MDNGDTARRDALKLLAALPLTGGLAGPWLRCDAIAADTLPTGFTPFDRVLADPPVQARPGIFWYWMNGNVTREGITADLESMREAGLSTVMLFSIGGEGPATVIRPAAQSLTEPWWDLVAFAVAEAGRLGLEITLNACDGWATASGPWITPDLSMQKLVWSETAAKGGQRIAAPIATPSVFHDYYRDLRVVAYPHPAQWAETDATRAASISSSFGDPSRLSDPANSDVVIDSDDAGTIDYRFARPFTLRSLTIRTPPMPGTFPGVQRAANSLFVEASDDGLAWRAVGRLDYPRHGWETALTTLTHALPPTRARWFRLRHVPEAAGAYREDLHHAEYRRLRLTGISLSSRPRIHPLPAKSAEVWAIARRTDAMMVPDADSVPIDRMVDLTDRMAPDGMLDWTPPHGDWTIVRIGYTSTGKSNSIAGGGKGLECDKLSRAAARVQFDGWFGKALERVRPKLAGKVLHVLHVDSWEAGSQNWTPGFAQAFRDRQGYDLLPWLAVMTGVPVDSADRSERILFDVRRTIADLVRDEFYGEMAALAKANGCIFSGEVVNPTMVADGLDYGRHVDVPMGEFWLRTPQNHKPTDIREAVSAAHVYGRAVAGAEAFTEWELKWDETPWLMKARGDHHFAQGINRFYLHVYAHQPWTDRAPGMTLSGIGTFFSRTQTWWKPGKAWIDYLARSQALLQLGQPVVSAAVFIGEDRPARALLPQDLPVALPAGHSYDAINRDALMRLARVEDGEMTLPGGMRYPLLILPRGRTMTPDLADRLAAFAAAELPIFGEAPTQAPGGRDPAEEDRQVAAIGQRMQLRDYANLDRLLATPGLRLSGKGADGVEWLQRRGAGWTLYYVSNQSDVRLTIDAAVTGSGMPWLIRPDSGARDRVPLYRRDGPQIHMPLTLDPRESVFIAIIAGDADDPILSVEPPADLIVQPDGKASLLVTTPGRWSILRGSGRTQTVTNDRDAPAVAMDRWRLALPGQVERDWSRLASWHLSGLADVRHFSGTGHYRADFLMPSTRRHSSLRWLLDLGIVHDLAEVSVNGRAIATLWKPPFRIDVTAALRPGKNRIEVAVTNGWLNRLIGDAGRDQAERSSFVTPELRFGKLWQPTSRDALLPGGLIGPVRLESRIAVQV